MAKQSSINGTSAGKPAERKASAAGIKSAAAAKKKTPAAQPAAKPEPVKAEAAKPRARKTPPHTPAESKPAAGAAAAPAPVVVAAAAPVVAAAELGKKELVEQAVERSGVKKKDAKPVVEAVLALLGEAVAEGRELNLKPFGKLRINRSQERSNGKIFVCRLRQPDAPAGAAQENAEGEQKSSQGPLAEAASDG